MLEMSYCFQRASDGLKFIVLTNWERDTIRWKSGKVPNSNFYPKKNGEASVTSSVIL